MQYVPSPGSTWPAPTRTSTRSTRSATMLGGRVGLDEVLADLRPQGPQDLAAGAGGAPRLARSTAPTGATCAGGRRACPRRRTPRTSEEVAGRRIVAVAWYAKELPGDGVKQGSRVTFFDLATRRYRHVLLVVPSLTTTAAPGIEPLTRARRRDRLVRPLPARRGDGARASSPAASTTCCGCRTATRSRRSATATCCRCGSPTRPSTDEGHERLRYSFMSLDRRAPPAGARGRRVRPRSERHRRLGPVRARRRSRCCWQPARTASPALDARRGRRPDAGRRGRAGPLARHRLARAVDVRVGVRGRAGRVPAAPLGDADGAGGHRLLALHRHAVVGHRVAAAAVGLHDEALLVRLTQASLVGSGSRAASRPASRSTAGVRARHAIHASEAAGRAGATGRPAGPRSPRPRSPPRTCRRPCCG